MVLMEPVPQSIGHGRRSHGSARVARFRLLHSIDSQESDGVNTELIKGRVCQDGTPLAVAGLGQDTPAGEGLIFRLARLGSDIKGTNFPSTC